MIITKQTKFKDNNSNILNKRYILSIENKSTSIISKNKNMAAILNKLKEIYTDGWGPYNRFSQPELYYLANLIYKHISKTYIL